MTNSDGIVRYEDRYFTLIGDEQTAYYVRFNDSAMCVPLTDTGMVIFIVEPSPAFGMDVLLLPGGGLDPGETPEATANRELQEEIGYRAQRLDFLAELHPLEKYVSLSIFAYLARSLTPSKLHGDEIYEITTELVPLNEFERVIASGRLQDSNVIAALYMARQFLLQEASVL